MNAYKVDAIVTENGLAVLAGIPLPIGSSVEVIILDNGTTDGGVSFRNDNRQPLTIDSSANNRSFDSADRDYLVSISSSMTEWESAADESAYQDL
jgi:hypothetical protein